ncbi:hypothetical protein BAUCODRAFT_124604 [Baudoinia panamericana UAMH 10762]|uniref:Uncharacterized protein n=1 Tax=Baudoinia panamericana (strain UAMH 10762) TaxID=717646 RepID=M2LI42_BAUPA|nr:uncharacterized protein BAUCODRAFT_124604 [Baudoinia panamericana UAMH 10762]EMC93852.1 hypothetical protein BAUCODRAFT_124604 [Baudoinia panamericana UAMH 10762]
MGKAQYCHLKDCYGTPPHCCTAGCSMHEHLEDRVARSLTRQHGAAGSSFRERSRSIGRAFSSSGGGRGRGGTGGGGGRGADMSGWW